MTAAEAIQFAVEQLRPSRYAAPASRWMRNDSAGTQYAGYETQTTLSAGGPRPGTTSEKLAIAQDCD
jgi:hypothetical protein